MSGLLLGTNSVTALDLSTVGFGEGSAVGFALGELEVLGHICVIASTVKVDGYHYQSWWQWKEEAMKTMGLRDVRLSQQEVLCLGMGMALLLAGAHRETMAAAGMGERWCGGRRRGTHLRPVRRQVRRSIARRQPWAQSGARGRPGRLCDRSVWLWRPGIVAPGPRSGTGAGTVR